MVHLMRNQNKHTIVLLLQIHIGTRERKILKLLILHNFLVFRSFRL